MTVFGKWTLVGHRDHWRWQGVSRGQSKEMALSAQLLAEELGKQLTELAIIGWFGQMLQIALKGRRASRRRFHSAAAARVAVPWR
jgi:hypothetical protein